MVVWLGLALNSRSSKDMMIGVVHDSLGRCKVGLMSSSVLWLLLSYLLYWGWGYGIGSSPRWRPLRLFALWI